MAGGGVLVLILALVAACVPPLSNSLIKGALDARGLGPSKVQGAFIGPFGARIGHLVLGRASDISLEALRIAYSPLGLLSGEVDGVKAARAEVRAALGEKGFVPPLADAELGRGGGEGALLPPLPPIEIEEVKLVLEGLAAPAGFIGRLTTSRAGEEQTLALDGAVIYVKAWTAKASYTHDRAGNAALTAALAAPAGGPGGEVPAEFRSDIAPLAEDLSADLRIVQEAGLITALAGDLTAKAGDVFGVAFEELKAEVDIAPSTDGVRRTGRAGVALSGFTLDEQKISKLRDAVEDLQPLVALQPFARALGEAFGPEGALGTRPGFLRAGFERLDFIGGGGLFAPDIRLGQPILALTVPAEDSKAPAIVEIVGGGADDPYTVRILGLGEALEGRPFALGARLGAIDGFLRWQGFKAVRQATVSKAQWPYGLDVEAFEALADVGAQRAEIRVPALSASLGDERKGSLEGARLEVSGEILPGLRVDRLSTAFSGVIAREPAAWRVRPEGGCLELAAEAIAIAALEAVGAKISACTDESKPILAVTSEGRVMSEGTYALAARTVMIEGLEAHGTWPRGSYDLNIKGGEGKVVASLVAGPILLDAGSGGSRVRLEGIAADSTLTLEGGALTIRWPNIRARMKDTKSLERFAPVSITGEMALEADEFAGAFAASALGRVVGRATLSHRLEDGRGRLAFDTRDLAFARKGLQLQKLVPALRGVVTGTEGVLGAKGAIAWAPRRALASSGEVRFRRFGFTTIYGRIEGVEGDVRFTDLLPLRTGAPQQLKIAATDIGLPLANGTVELQFPGDNTLLVPEAKWPWSGGALGLVDAIIDPAAPVQTLAMRADGIDLTEVFRLLDIAGLEGTGVVDGRLPIEVRDQDAFFVGGRLKARSGGVLKYTGEAAAAAASSGEGASLLFTALENFIYDTLEIGIDGRLTGVIDVTIKLRGYNPKVYDAYPFELNISIQSELANLLLESTKGLRIPEEIRRTLTEGQ